MPGKKTKKSGIETIAYSTDASMIEGNATLVIFPKSAEEISILIRGGGNFTIRGGGTGLAGGAVPQNEIVLDLSKMNKVIDFDREKRTIKVEAGIILDELQEELDKHGLEFPVNPSSHSVCTIGGMIATNAVGSRALKYGRTGNWIEELEVVSGKGEIIKITKANLQDFSGLEGITGVIVKAKLKVIEKKERTASLFAISELKDVYDSARKLKMLSDVSAIEFLDKLTSSLLGLEEKYHIIAEFESDRGKAKGEKYNDLMNLRDRAYPALASAGYIIIEDPKILLHKFQELGEFLEIEKIPFFGHLSVGIIHPVFRKEDEVKIKSLMNYVKKMHGQVSGEHGIGLRKKEFLENTEKKLILSIKKRYDPFCKMNCKKVIDMQDKSLSEEVIERRKEAIKQAEEIIKEQNKEIEEENKEAEEIKENIEESQDAEEIIKNSGENSTEAEEIIKEQESSAEEIIKDSEENSIINNKEQENSIDNKENSGVENGN